MSNKNLTYLFNPSQKEAQQLKKEFVVRTAVFEQIFTDIQSDKMQKPPQHYMLLGQRGMGKTTLLLRLKYAIQDDENLSNWLLPIVFNEEQYSMPDLASFFEHIAKLLTEINSKYENLLASMRLHEYEKDYEQRSFEILVECLKQNQQKIIVFHDNFGQFLEKIGKSSTHRLRNILMNSNHIRLIGASATLLKHNFDYKEPFFDFFYQIHLRGLSSEETLLLFKKLAENAGKTEEYKEILKSELSRMDVIRKLSGGVLRTMVMLFDVFIDNEKQDSFKDLESILDRVTPLYKHRVDDLKPQQQLIVDAVAKAWDAVTVSEIAEIARAGRQGLKTNQISAQLKQLVDNQIIEIEPRTQGRTNLYRLQERFFNIWYLMRYSTRQDKQRVIWFVKFLESWCNTIDLKQLLNRFQNNLELGTYELSTVFDRALAYSLVENDEILNDKNNLLEKAINLLHSKKYEIAPLKILTSEKYKIKAHILKRDMDQNPNKNIFNTIKELIEIALIEMNYVYLFGLLKITSRIKQILLEPNFNATEELEFYLAHVFDLYLLVENHQIHISFTISKYIKDNFDKFLEYYEHYIYILLAQKQYHSAYKFFKENSELKDLLKPIYYLLMEYLQDEYPNEYLKAGEEFRETIDQLKELVKCYEDHLN